MLPKRFGKYGLTLHPKKTRLIPFRRPPRGPKPARNKRPGTFDLLGFTHYWGKLQRGTWVVMRRTMKSRLTRAVRSFADWCRRARHQPIREQRVMLVRKLRGHYNYYGITGNSQALGRLLFAVYCVWKKWLSRRNQRGMSWERFEKLRKRAALPEPRIMHRTLIVANTVT